MREASITAKGDRFNMLNKSVLRASKALIIDRSQRRSANSDMLHIITEKTYQWTAGCRTMGNNPQRVECSSCLVISVNERPLLAHG